VGDQVISRLELRIRAEPACFAPYELVVDGLAPGLAHTLSPVPL
jgi:hypothetical protein